ncbi:Malonyl CoA-acyl carrier protein transacylase [Enhygromyxa salina]|uniref:Malonyl CoA-acyl carrier protein transacylase n=1 Tax=Enhygromyxa salina TaxID=215803 RepID=A0A0C2DDB4_9BACT|nr:SDR family NAD(P)-dependent oxidoreductase [Enhygromyxa salina]KIG19430.1 Malonyl CoA-acyl carrier protein transacylase [Enhygromyxa salina]
MKRYDIAPIAVIGLACRFPGSTHAREFWAQIVGGRDCIREIPASRWDWREVYGDPDSDPGKTNSRWGGFIDGIEHFDPLFFGMAPKQAAFIDPQQRLALECAWHTIEDAGYPAAQLAGQRIGVYVGVSKNDYSELMRERKAPIPAAISTGTVHSIIANRISYLLDLRGKSEVIDTACSSALVALDHAIRDIRLGECEAALVGGVNALLSSTMYISHAQSGMLSPRGRCRSFDRGADGYVRGEGVGFVFLKPLARAREDGDRIIGVIRGSAVNHGGRANSLTTPSVDAQAEVIRQALADADVDPASITFIEAHGTGTPLGDPVEIRALRKAFADAEQTKARPWCGIGTVKTNIGHLESAAGIAGLIKLLLCLEHRTLPGLLHFRELNPFIELDDGPFFILDETRAWESAGPRRAGLSAFGMGGVNAHVIVEEGPAPAPGRRVSLPAHAFERRRCWFEPPREPGPRDVLVLRPSDPVLSDHVVAGSPMLPGVALLEAIRALVEAQRGEAVTGLAHVYWMRPLRPVADARVELELQPAQTGDDVTLVHEATAHVTATPTLGAGVERSPEVLDLAGVRERCQRRQDPRELYRRFAAYGLDYGPRFRVITSCVHAEGELLCELVGGPSVEVGGPARWEPSLLDGVMQSVVALELLDGGEPREQRVPYSLDALQVHRELPRVAYAYVRRDPSAKGEPRFNMRLCTEAGNVIAAFNGFVKRALATTRPAREPDPSRPIYGYTSRRVPAPLRIHCETPEELLLISPDDGLARGLERAAARLTRACPLRKSAARSTRLEADRFELDLTCEGDVDALFEDLARVRRLPDTVVLDARGEDNVGADHLHSLLYLCRALVRAKLPSVRVLHLRNHARGLADGVHAMVGGFARTLARENPQIQLVAIACDLDTEDAVLRAELGHYAEAAMAEVEHRGGRRLVREMVEVPTPRAYTETQSMIREHGRYLISGGMGALGLAVAQHLARDHAASLVLLGRSPMTADIRARLESLSAAGGDAIYMQADVSERAQVEAVFAELGRRDLQLDGIIHAAGLIEDAFVLRKRPESLDRVLAPKVAGALNLDAASTDHPLGLFVLFSSVASLMPNQGQCDYAAANAFLDHFAAQRELLREAGRRRGATLAINWPLWAKGGITVAPEEREHLWTEFGMHPMATAVGVELFARLTCDAGSSPHYAPIEGDRDKIEAHLRIAAASAVVEVDETSTSSSSLSGRIDRMLAALVDREAAPARGHGRGAPTLSELGLDSLGMIRFADRLSSELGLEIKPSIFFEYATVPSLVAYLAQRKPAISEPRAAALIDGRHADADAGADGTARFRKRLHNEVFFMRDHVVDGQFNLPGACFVELAVQAAALEHGRLPRRAINNLWIEKLSSADAPIEIEISLVGGEPALGYEIARTRAGQRTIHAVGELELGEFGELSEDGLGDLDLAAIRQRCSDRRAPDEVYPQIIDEGLHIGPSIMPLVELHLGPGEALARLELPPSLASTAPDYTLHPTMLTGVLQAALLLNKPHGSDGSQYIPVGIDVIEFDGPLPSACYVHCRPQAGGDGMRKFEAAIARLDGRVVARATGISLRRIRKADHAADAMPAPASTTASQAPRARQTQAETILREIVAEAVGLAAAEVEATREFEAYGISSIMIVDLNRRLEQRFGRLSKTLFFEYRNVRELAAYFVEAHGARVAALGAPAIPSPVPPVAAVDAAPPVAAAEPPAPRRAPEGRTRASVEPIDDGVAIIGLAGRYPGADDLEEFWRALESGRDCITQIPPDRFEYERLFNPDPDAEQIYARWGGFIRGVDEFDPRLFNITPRDAGLIDPQARLFLEVVWEALEDAGHTPASLTARSRRIGVFVGALWQPYVNLGVERSEHGQAIAPSGLLYNIPNRVSYFFDWTGPSLAIDTACSGSLTALHYAVSSLLRGEVDGAVVGGVNLSLSSSKYLFLSQNRFLSSDGRCRSFGEGGDGYVPGEGVGAVLLKRLADARADGDRIDAIIRSTSVNHGGRTSGYTVPNPNQQAELITEALAAAQLDAGAVSYVEAHGTGTSLGDPIEITGLAKAFERATTDAPTERACAIGSVKSNIGHLEAAAGIAGLTKLVLQLRHGVLVPSLHAERLNPNLELERTPFRVQRRREAWVRPREEAEGAHELPRVALLSSFGAGGSNAHAVVSEPEAVDNAATTPAEFPAGLARVFVLSARGPEQLQRQAHRLADALAGQPADKRYSLAQIASTLQTGRTAQTQRAAVVVDDFDALVVSLRALGAGEAQDDVFVGATGTTSMFDADLLQQMAGRWLERGQVRELARAWVEGLDLDWRSFAGQRPQPVSLPTYPFERLRCWLPALPADIPGSPRTLHPLVHENVSSVDRCAFRSQLSSAEFIFADHHIRGRAVLPAVVQLEMVRHAVELAGARVGSFRRVLLIRPITAEGPTCEIEVGLERAGAELNFELSSGTGEDRIVYTAGQIAADAGESAPGIDTAALEARYGQSLSGERFYASLRDRGVDLGPGLRNIQEVWRDDRSALARISTPAGMSLERAAWTQRDAVLQLAGMLSPEGGSFIPFEIARVELFGPAVANGWVHVTTEKQTARSRRLAGVITDNAGRVITRVLGIVTRDASVSLDTDRAPASSTRPAAPPRPDDHPRQVVYAVPTWIDRQHGSAVHEGSVARLLTCGLGSRVDLRTQLGAVELLPASWEQERSTNTHRLDLFDDLTRVALAAVEDQLRRELEASAAERRGLVVTLADGLAPVAEALAALLRSVSLEHPSLRGKVVLLAPEALESGLVGRVEAELTHLEALEVRLEGATGRLVRGWNERVPSPAASPSSPVLRAGGRYWITGGLGGLGRLLARHAAARQPGVRLLLSGRSEPRPEDRAFLHELRKLGAEVEYLRADVRELVDCEAAVARARARFGGLDGIVHAAGVLRDGFFATRDRQAAQEVLAPKLRGVVNLEQATQAEALEFMILFGSFAAVAGNPGQTDYAAANAFMAGFAAQRHRLELAGLRSGRCVCVHWPLWSDCGMTMSEAASASLEARTGFGPLPAELGLEAFDRALEFDGPELLVGYGDLEAMRTRTLRTAAAAQPYTGGSAPAPGQESQREPTRGLPPRTASAVKVDEALATELREVLSELTQIPAGEIEARLSFGELGLDSVALVRLAKLLGARFGLELMPTLFFEYPTLASLEAHLIDAYGQHFAAHFADAALPALDAVTPRAEPAPPVTSATSEPLESTTQAEVSPADIAVIGMSGRFADAKDVDELWANLVSGREHIREIPVERFDVRPYYNPDAEPGADAIYCPWGSFITDAEGFDAGFFEVGPREATWMDPQLRLVLQSAYHTAEDAGVAGGLHGTDTGVFVGACFHDYRERLQAADVEIDPHYLTGIAATSLANRVSFCFDLRGPSLPFDTACSSALFALDAACKALRAADCGMALVAGVNLILSPTRHRYFSSLGALSRTGRCHSFDAAADGYVPGEAVVSVLLKPLSQAIADGDRIHGVIKATAVRHSGRTATLTAPSVDGEVNVLLAAWRDANIDPATLSYIEAHGTGTALGDPIEVRALQKAFAQAGAPAQRCTLGSAKASLGHTEGAAGLVGVVKVLLQMRARELPVMPGFQTLNPRIDLSDGTLRINTAREPWLSEHGLRRAGVSSFGFTGAFAHVVLEEYVDVGPRAPADPASRPLAFPLAAKTLEVLRQRAGALAEHLSEHPSLSTHDLAHTLARREPLAQRVVFHARDLPELRRELEHFADGATAASGRGIEWPREPSHPHARLLSLPGYPFATTRFTVEAKSQARAGRLRDSAVSDSGLAAAGEDSIAIVGLSGRFPMARDLVELFDRLADGVDCISTIPGDRWDPAAHRHDSKHGRSEARWGGFLDRIDTFDYERFQLSFRDAALIHPEERLLLEEAWSCFESAALDPLKWTENTGPDGGAEIGVYVGASFHDYPLVIADLNRKTGAKLPCSTQTFSYANRLSHFYNLRGPSVVMDAACSSSLYAIYAAYQALRRGDCRMALAGGANLNLHPSKYAFLNDRNFLATDGRCRAFAEGGDGYVPGEGVGLVLLAPLSEALRDGLPVLAVIRGGAAGNDGRTHGFTVPNPNAQRDTIVAALRDAGVDAQTVTCVECHGTGTSLGDPIEVAALRDAFGPGPTDSPSCALSSIKSNIGHLEAAAGISQVAKMVLQLGHRSLFPNLTHGEGPNPILDLASGRFHVETRRRDWTTPEGVELRRAGISSFGAGGTNVHLVVEQAPPREHPPIDPAREYAVVLSADTEDELRRVVEGMRTFLTSPSWSRFNARLSVRDVAGTLQTGRAHRVHRLAVLCGESIPELIRRLRDSAEFLAGRLGGAAPSYLLRGDANARPAGATVDAGSPRELAERWVAGARVEWAAIAGSFVRLYLPSARARPTRVTALSLAGDDRGAVERAPSSRSPAAELDTGRRIEAALRQVLGVLPPSFNQDMDFAELGIDSILSTQIHTALAPSFPQLEAYALFEYPSVAQLRAHLEGAAAPNDPEPVELRESGAIAALEFGQERTPIREYLRAHASSSSSAAAMSVHAVDVGDGRTLEAVVCGDGPPVVLLPPFNSTAIIWIQQLLHLSDDYQLIVPHYPGIDGSDWDDRVESLDDVADAVARSFAQLQRDGIVTRSRAQWVGWSLGGFIAQILATRHAALVERLVLISTTTISWSSDEYQVSPEVFSRLCAAEFHAGFDKLPEFIRQHPQVRALEARGQLEKFVVGSVDRRVINRYFRMIARFRHSDAARSITQPTCLISGENDELMPAKFARRLSREIQGSEYHEVPGGLHFLSLFCFEAINEKLRSWLKSS